MERTNSHDRPTTDSNVQEAGQVVGRELDMEEEPRYGWVIVASVFIINAHTWGLIQAYGVFLSYYLNSGVFERPDTLTLAFMAGLGFASTLLVSPLVTMLIPRIGVKPTVVIGITGQAGSLIAASFCSQLWQLVLAQGLGFGAFVGFVVNTTVTVTPQWFTRRRSFATSITTGGSGIGGLIYSLAIHSMIRNIELAWALRALAAIAFTVCLVCCLFLKDRKKDIKPVYNTFQISLFKEFDFVLLILWGVFSQLGFAILIFSIADFSSSMGFSPTQGSISVSMMNLSIAIGRPLIGLQSDRWGRFNVAGLSCLIAAGSTLIIWTSSGQFYCGLIVYVLFGAFASSMWPTVAAVAAEVVGITYLPSALSILWLSLVPSTLFAAPIALSMRSPGKTGYIAVQVFTGCLYILAFLAVWMMRSRKLYARRNHADDEKKGSAREDRKPETPFSAWVEGFLSVEKI